MPANLENSAVATGLEKVSLHSNPKEGQSQRMFKLLYNCTHFTCQQGHTQNPPSQASKIHELKNFRCSNWIQKRQRKTRDQISNICWVTKKARGFQKNIYFPSLTTLKPLMTKAFVVWVTTKCGIFFKRWEYQTTLPAS